MSLYVRSESTPILPVSREFYGKETAPCVRATYQYQDWYYGAGLPPAEHPGWNSEYEVNACPACQSKEILVIATQSCVHPYSGDYYYDGEFVCQGCNTFTAVSYSENG